MGQSPNGAQGPQFREQTVSCEWVDSYWHINTSPGYTVPFTSVHAGKYRTEDRHYKTKHNPEKANNTKYSKTELAWFSRSTGYDTQPGNEVGLFYNAPEPKRG